MVTSPEKETARGQTSKRKWKMQSLSDSLAKLTKDICNKQGFAQSEIITRWGDIVGPTLAAHSIPERLVFAKGQAGATLHILADSGFATEFQYLAPQAIDRINGYFGYPAIAKLAVKQGPVSMHPRRRRRPLTPSPEDLKGAEEIVGDVKDKNLRAALLSFGATIMADSRQRKP